jgi:hypothetical protein
VDEGFGGGEEGEGRGGQGEEGEEGDGGYEEEEEDGQYGPSLGDIDAGRLAVRFPRLDGSAAPVEGGMPSALDGLPSDAASLSLLQQLLAGLGGEQGAGTPVEELAASADPAALLAALMSGYAMGGGGGGEEEVGEGERPRAEEAEDGGGLAPSARMRVSGGGASYPAGHLGASPSVFVGAGPRRTASHLGSVLGKSSTR